MRIYKVFIVLLIMFSITSCATILPKATVTVTETGVIMESNRTGKITYKDDKVDCSFDSKGESIIKNVTKEILPILTLKALDD